MTTTATAKPIWKKYNLKQDDHLADNGMNDL